MRNQTQGGEAPAPTGRDTWIAAARATLIRAGHSQVKIERLAGDLGVTRGGFYWHFKSRADLLAHLLADWETTNSTGLLDALSGNAPPRDRLYALARVWIDEIDFSPAYDSAIRDWARVSPEAAKTVRAVDDRRLAALNVLFLDAGYPPDEAMIRARITYYHQVGYYAMGVQEPKAVRDRNLRHYVTALFGEPPQP